MHVSVILPITTVLVSLVAPASAGTISNPEAIFGELRIPNGIQQEEAYHKLSVPAQHAFWIGKLSNYRAKHLTELNENQIQVLDTAISSVTSTLTTEGEYQLKKAMMDAFGDKKATTLLARLDNGDDDTMEADGTASRVCPCAVDSSYCGVWNCKPANSCEVKKGCGTFHQHYCNGRCKAEG